MRNCRDYDVNSRLNISIHQAVHSSEYSEVVILMRILKFQKHEGCDESLKYYRTQKH